MGYHVTILRSSKGKQLPISLNEAVAAAKSIEGWSCTETPPTFEYSSAEGSSAFLVPRWGTLDKESGGLGYKCDGRLSQALGGEGTR